MIKVFFEQLLISLNPLFNSEYIKIGFKSISYYALNLKLFLENTNHSFMEVNPILINYYGTSIIPY